MDANKMLQEYEDLEKQINALDAQKRELYNRIRDEMAPFKKGSRIQNRNDIYEFINCDGFVTRKGGELVFDCSYIYALKIKKDGTPSKVRTTLYTSVNRVKLVEEPKA